MGIDPVTHTPRLDLLELSSILSSTLYNNNSSQLNVPNLLGVGPILNPNLINLATALLSCQSSKSHADQYVSQNLQENQLGQVQNQFQSFQPDQLQNPIRNIQTCTTSNTTTSSTFPFCLNETQLVQAKMDQQISSAPPQSLINFGCPVNSISTTSLWQNSNHRDGSTTPESLFSIPNNGYHQQERYQPTINSLSSSENQAFVSNNNIPNMSFNTLLSSAPSSYAATPLNSSSITYVNGSSNNEDERDSFCSSFMMYDVPNSMNIVNELL